MHAAFDCARFKTLASLPLIALAEELSACTYLSEEATLAVSFARRRIKYDLRNTADLRFFTSPTHVSCSELINELKTSSIKSEKNAIFRTSFDELRPSAVQPAFTQRLEDPIVQLYACMPRSCADTNSRTATSAK